ncbi:MULTISPECIES: MCE family protein [Mycobacteriaceae]|uniref:Virulence factor Mce family protein n=1 Tax=Mycolicibacterium fortuitum TaxID=1766 RepID=A0A378V0D4_MYCFO|nr:MULTISPECIES: MCE family protein [Mycobacteriaceae]MCA4756787.1 MCE family protein [Mycolicibacterium fortuitum]MDG5770526.1 MCE family protein [Mycolicibacterium fortuitum]MDG5781985.1 MCE family protein [Mycolicibacterium fortuitum]NOQ60127.1 MCE family protein [Mycolicibacterium fortuitum]OBG48244.1 mammalian cell entry protein [Mycolicibacterium fortuitum]
MTKNLAGIVWRLAIFMTACILALAATVIVFAQFRFGGDAHDYSAQFSNVSGLREGDMVRVAGVEVGKISHITVNPDATVQVDFTAGREAVLTEGTRAEIRYDDLIGGRYMTLTDGAASTAVLAAGATIPLDRTQPALDLDSVTGGFRPLFRALDPEKVNELSGQLLQALQGEGVTIGSFLNHAAALTNTLADRDVLIGQVVDNLNVVLGSLGGQTDQLDKAVTNLSELVAGLAERKSDISNAVAHTNAASATIADLLGQTRQPAQKVIRETDRVAGNVLLDHEYFDRILNELPDKYRILNRQGMYGDYFSFYFCDVVLKLNGKGGQPVFVKVAGQSTGRCAPR